MASKEDFTEAEWSTMRRAIVAAGVLVSIAEGVVDPDEILALTDRLGRASRAHGSLLVRQLAQMPRLSTGLRPGTRLADYRGPALELIRSASAVLVRKAPAELCVFREFVLELAEVVAHANKEGGFLGVGGRRRTPAEAAAIESIRRALGAQ